MDLHDFDDVAENYDLYLDEMYKDEDMYTGDIIRRAAPLLLKMSFGAFKKGIRNLHRRICM